MNKIKIGIIGTHYSGKTSVCHQLVGSFRAEGVLVDYVREAARNSYYLASGIFNYAMQLDILCRQISEELEMCRTSELTICDRTVFDVLAYSNSLESPKTEIDKIYKSCIENMTFEFCKTYDLIFLKTDFFDTNNSNDPLVSKDDSFQLNILNKIKELLLQTNTNYVEIDNNNAFKLVKNTVTTLIENRKNA